MRVGDTQKWLMVQAFDPTSGIIMDTLHAADFPALKIYNGTTLVTIAALSDAANMNAWVEGGIYNAGKGRYFVGMPDPSWAAAALTDIWGKSDTVEVEAIAPIDVQLPNGLTGPSSVTITFQDSAMPTPNRVPLVDFMIIGQGPGRADTNGVAAFGLTDGTFTLSARPTDGILFADTVLVVSGTTVRLITGSAVVLPAASNPSQSRGALRCYDQQGNPHSDAKIIIQQRASGTTGAWPNNFLTVLCDGDGDVIDASDSAKGVLHARGVDYRARRGNAPDRETEWVYYTVPDAPSFSMPTMLGKD